MTPLLDNTTTAVFLPKAALVVFRSEISKETYLELRDIYKDGTMGAAKPVSNDFIQKMLSLFSKEYRNTPHGEIPPNMLYCDVRQGRETYIWYNEPCKRFRHFSEKLDLKDGTYHVPGTIYAVRENRLRVFCFKGRKAKAETHLLGVPYFNIYKDGTVCMGSAVARIPDRENLSFNDIMYAWEYAFWNSVDVHANGSPSTKANLIETIKKYRDMPFDTSELVSRTDIPTVKNLINEMMR